MGDHDIFLTAVIPAFGDYRETKAVLRDGDTSLGKREMPYVVEAFPDSAKWHGLRAFELLPLTKDYEQSLRAAFLKVSAREGWAGQFWSDLLNATIKSFSALRRACAKHPGATVNVTWIEEEIG